VVKARVDAIVSGIALNIIAFGLSRVVLRVLFDSASNSPRLPGFGWGTWEHPLPRVLADPVVLLAIALVPGIWALLHRTRAGLRLRAAGDNAAAAAAAGISVPSVQLLGSTLCGAVAGLGGAHLVFDQRHFDAGMSGGRGFIALAAVILGGYRPLPVALACLGFAALEATQIAVQDLVHVPPELVQMLPYVGTLVLLGTIGRLGKRRLGPN
jgi:general nucleoside transport system permease protein